MTENEKLRALLAEAQAEIGEVQVQIGMSAIRHRLEASEIRRLLGSLSDALYERNQARVESASAYRRGAEAMREAAARELDRLLTKKKATAIWVAPDEIRAMPVPEDDR